MRMPPNPRGVAVPTTGEVPSMEGGMRMPPNRIVNRGLEAGPRPSMEGGMRMPPNRTEHTRSHSRIRPFNGGRHAHAAEFEAGASFGPVDAPSMEGGMRMPPNHRAAGGG